MYLLNYFQNYVAFGLSDDKAQLRDIDISVCYREGMKLNASMS